MAKQEAITEIMSWLRETKSFITEQAPEVVQQILTLCFWKSLLGASILLVVGTVIMYWGVRWIKLGRKTRDSEAQLGGYCVGFIGSLVWGCMLVCLYHTLFITFFPKVYLLEYLGGLVK